ncbi:hypothetical protein Phum_PHUM077510 [Pediculus humanus corporis]|uniref:Uncharacterized protein n=1 Tax=Pediculus humanus subsp. corporis TaxID=121224 RepID=E0VC19_PEDHC|nr:uncharacterized protein Phum_PHUM077510 [Pediculus humanus corporis]EEB10925.1 hypothetical protein Phum_PHUM077510 [Pediculus humanus corporis]
MYTKYNIKKINTLTVTLGENSFVRKFAVCCLLFDETTRDVLKESYIKWPKK